MKKSNCAKKVVFNVIISIVILAIIAQFTWVVSDKGARKNEIRKECMRCHTEQHIRASKHGVCILDN